MAREDELRGIAFDAGSVREIDENGFMHVAVSPLTREQVAPYYGREIPGSERMGFEPEGTYMGWRPAEELSRPETLKSTNGIPIHLQHHPDYADSPAKETRVGQTGTDAEWRAPYLMNSLHILDREAQERIRDGTMRELSLAYSYRPEFTKGTAPGGEKYDFIMRDILANHVALVREGRAGPQVLVYDAKKGADMDVEKNGAGEKLNPAAQALAETFAALPEDTLERLGKALALLRGGEEAKDADQEEVPADAPVEIPPVEEPQGEAPAEDEEEPAAPEEKPALPEAEDEEEPDAKLIEDGGMAGEPPEVQQGFLKGIIYQKNREAAKAAGAQAPEAPEAQDEECDKDKRIAQDAVRTVKAHFAALDEVRPVLGRIRIDAFDSAEDVYTAALKKAGITGVKKGAAREAFRAYMAGTKKAPRAAGLAQDAASKEEPTGLMALMAGVKTNF